MVGRSTEKAGFLQRIGSPRSGRHLARFLKGIRRSRALIAVITGDSAFLLLAHVLSARLEFVAKPAANVGFHRIPRCRRRLDATALLAFECPAVEAGGSALDPKEKHSRVIAHRTARPLDRGEVGWVDRLIFRHGTSPRRSVTNSSVTDGCRDSAVINPPCRRGDLTRWSILLIFQEKFDWRPVLRGNAGPSVAKGSGLRGGRATAATLIPRCAPSVSRIWAGQFREVERVGAADDDD
jgi:hypothetical protein